MNMIIMPVPVSHTPDTCPKCKQLENIKEVCAHCGYEYPEEDGEFPVSLGWLILAGIAIGGYLGNQYMFTGFGGRDWSDIIFGTFFGGVFGFAAVFFGGLVLVFLSWLISSTFGSKE